MGFLRRLLGGSRPATPAAAPVDSAAELDAALADARRRHQRVRNDAARMVAELTVLEGDLDAAADDVGEARELTATAVRRAEQARAAGDASEAEALDRTSRSLAARLVAAEDRLAALTESYRDAAARVDRAHELMAESGRGLAALEQRRRTILASLQEAVVGESTEAALAPTGGTARRLDEVERHVEERVAMARARAELRSVEGAAGLAVPPVDRRADDTLAAIRAEVQDEVGRADGGARGGS